MGNRSKPGKGSKSLRLDVMPEPETLQALRGIQDAWGGTMGHSIACVLDLWCQHALFDAWQLRHLVAERHPAFAGQPLLKLPPDVFLDALRAQDLAQTPPEGRA